jgi:hypothetical protein
VRALAIHVCVKNASANKEEARQYKKLHLPKKQVGLFG